MRYGIKPKTRGQKPDRLLRQVLEEKPTLKRWFRIAYPFYIVEIDVFEEKRSELSRLEYFVLRTVYEGNARSLEDICEILGLDAKYIRDVLQYLVSVLHLIEQSEIGLKVTEKGIFSLETNSKQVPGVGRKCILLEGIYGKPLAVDYYNPNWHTFLNPDELSGDAKKLIPKGISQSDFDSIVELPREVREAMGLPVDVIGFDLEKMAYQIVYHNFYVGLTAQGETIVYDSCNGEERSEFSYINYNLLQEIVPELSEAYNPEYIKKHLANYHPPVEVEADDIVLDNKERIRVHVSKENLDTGQGWEKYLLYRPRVNLYNGFIINIYPKDFDTLKRGLLAYLLNCYKRAMNNHLLDEFDLGREVEKGYEELTADAGLNIDKPMINYNDIRSYALDKKEHLVVESIDENLNQEEEDYSDLFA